MGKLEVSLEEIRQASSDARLNLTPQEENELKNQITDFFRQVTFLQYSELEKVRATYYPHTQENILREDLVRPSLPLEMVMLNAPDADTDFFHVPKIVE